MSKLLSLKMQDDIFEETEKVLHRIRVPRNSYINAAVRFYNKLQKRALLKKQLASDSQLVRDNSMEVLKTFEAFEEEFPEN